MKYKKIELTNKEAVVAEFLRITIEESKLTAAEEKNVLRVLQVRCDRRLQKKAVTA